METIAKTKGRINRDTLTTAEACALIEAKLLSADLTARLVGWMIETTRAKSDAKLGDEMALFVRAHRELIEEQPSKVSL